MNSQKIYYKKVRDISGVFSAAFGFIKQNFKPFYGSLLLLAGPFILIGSAISAYMIGSSGIYSNLMQNSLSAFYTKLLVSYAFSMIFIFIGVAIYNVVLNKNIIENEKLQDHESLTINHSTTGFFVDFWRMIANMLLLSFIFVLAIFIVVLVFFGLFSLIGGPNGSAGSIVMIVIGVLLVLAFLVVFGPILSFLPLASLFVCQRDKINVIAAIKKVLYYLKDNFWMTWIVSFVAIITYSIMGFVVQIPVFIVTLMTTLTRLSPSIEHSQDQQTSLVMVIVIMVCTLMSYAVASIYYLMTVYQFTSLEEKKEGSSIIEKINQIQ